MKLTTDNPFLPANEAAYQTWRTKKLAQIADTTSSLIVEIKDPCRLSDDEYRHLADRIAASNMAVFKLTNPDHFSVNDLKLLGNQLGLCRLDSNLYANEEDVSELRVIETGRRGEYIPYTDRALSWHTDGYYNHPDHSIRAFILYCVTAAKTGGDNQLLDPELIYISLRDENPEYITALMQDDVLTIPETIEAGELIRPLQQSAVFSIDPQTGKLLTRYTQRKTHIQWKNDPLTKAALTYFGELLADNSTSILDIRLNSGEGLICNNVLHNRSAFEDSTSRPRIMYRARYYDCFGDKQNLTRTHKTQ